MTALAIDVHDLRKSFGARPVIDGLTLQVPEGEICGFLGGNGSGKTTTIRMLCGLLRPDGGSGTCLGMDLLRDAPRIRLQIGYMTQRFSFYGDLTVTENLEFVARLYQIRDRRRAVAEVLERIGLADRADQLAQELSGGWKQRMALAACVLHRPRLLLLDEPTAGVDAKARREFWDMIHEMAADGMTVLVSTHYMDEAERCQRVVYLAGGRLVVQGTADEVVHAAHLVTFEATGDGIEQAVRQLRHLPGVETAAVFGRALRIAGMDRAALRAAIDSLGDDDAALGGGRAAARRRVHPHAAGHRGMNGFSFARLFAMLIKESLQMRRDRATVGLTVMLPLVQLFLFGYAINANPRHLPTGLLAAEHSTYERTLAGGAAEHRVFRHPADGDRGRGRAGAGARRRDVRAEHSAGLLAPHRSRRAAAGADGRRCHRSDRDRQRDRGGGGAERHGAEPRPAGGHAGAAGAAAVPDRAARPLQSGADHRAEHRARADRADPDRIHAGDDDARHHARARDRARWRTCWRCRCGRWR